MSRKHAGVAASLLMLGATLAVYPKLQPVAAASVAGAYLVARPKHGIFVLVLAGIFYGSLLRWTEGHVAALVWRDIIVVLLLGRTLLSPARLERAVTLPWRPVLVWMGIGVLLLAFASSSSRVDAVLGLRVTFEGVALLFIARAWLDEADIRRGLYALLPVVIGVVAFSAWQSQAGVEGLLARGYAYGRNVREFGEYVRAFGTMATSGQFGHSMGVLAIGYIALAHGKGRDQAVGVVGAVVCLGGALLSINRTAVLGVVLSFLVLLTLQQARGRVSARARLLAVVLVFGLPAAVVLSRGVERFGHPFVARTESVSTRVEAWRNVASKSNLVVGSGPGAVGAAARKRLDRENHGFVRTEEGLTDNYYVAVIAQYGIAGLLALVLIVRQLWRRARDAYERGSAGGLAGPGAILIVAFVALSMITTNLWEDYPTHVFFWTMLGAFLSVSTVSRVPEFHA